MVEFKRILFPCDLTENSTRLMPYVLTVSERFNGTICLLHVVEDLLGWGGFYVPHLNLNKLQEEIFQACERYIDEVCETELQGCPNFQRSVVSGDPATEILKTITAEAIDLVIMGTHGRKGLEHTIFGSVAENVVKQSPVPVMVINPYKLE
jgi:nucleotide-binding universal stress UspA family protein